MMNDNYVVPVATSKKIQDGLWKGGKILYISIVLILLYLPVIFMIMLSFSADKSGNALSGFTIENYLTMFEKKKLTDAILNTLSISILSTVASTVLGSWDCRIKNICNFDYSLSQAQSRVKYPMSHDEIGNIDGTRLVCKIVSRDLNISNKIF